MFWVLQKLPSGLMVQSHIIRTNPKLNDIKANNIKAVANNVRAIF